MNRQNEIRVLGTRCLISGCRRKQHKMKNGDRWLVCKKHKNEPCKFTYTGIPIVIDDTLPKNTILMVNSKNMEQAVKQRSRRKP